MVISSILTQHADEAAFLYFLRGRAVRAPHYTLKTLNEVDNRLEAHMDGMRIAMEDGGWEPCQAVLDAGDPGGLFVMAQLAFEGGYEERAEAVLQAAGASEELCKGVIAALGWLLPDQAWKPIRGLMNSEIPWRRRIAVAACAIQRLNPGPALVNALGCDEPRLKARALRAVGELGLTELMPDLHRNLRDIEPECRFQAHWSAALLGDSNSAAALANQEFSRPEEVAVLAARCLQAPIVYDWQNRLARDPVSARIAMLAAGAFGDPARMPWILEQINQPDSARVAGEAFSMITGVDLHREGLDRANAEAPSDGPTEDPEDEKVELSEDENLAAPDAVLVERWWGKNRDRFEPGVRHLLGKPITVQWCRQVLRQGYQRQRWAAALELAIRQAGTPLFEVRAPGFRQLRMLS